MNPTILPRAQRPETVKGGITGKHVLLAMIGFFGVVFAVNGVLLWKALATHSGLVANEPYRKGLAYNERIEAGERQGRLGWSDDIKLAGNHGISISMTTDAGAPVSGLAITALVGRPTTTKQDIRLAFAETAPGRYEAATQGLEAGAWVVSLEAKQSITAGSEPTDAPVYRAKKRLWLAP